VLRRLKEAGYIKKDDIEANGLFWHLCTHEASHFPEKRFQFFADWDPNALTRIDRYGGSPLHYAAAHASLKGFRLVFEAGVRHFPKTRGITLLFQDLNRHGRTPFKMAWGMHGREEMLNEIEKALIDCSNNPYDAADALTRAAINDNIDLDGIYFILRREPDALEKLLSA